MPAAAAELWPCRPGLPCELANASGFFVERKRRSCRVGDVGHSWRCPALRNRHEHLECTFPHARPRAHIFSRCKLQHAASAPTLRRGRLPRPGRTVMRGAVKLPLCRQVWVGASRACVSRRAPQASASLASGRNSAHSPPNPDASATSPQHYRPAAATPHTRGLNPVHLPESLQTSAQENVQPLSAAGKKTKAALNKKCHPPPVPPACPATGSAAGRPASRCTGA